MTNEYDQIFDPIVIIGHCDLISWYSDYSTHLVYEPTSFTLSVSMTRSLTQK